MAKLTEKKVLKKGQKTVKKQATKPCSVVAWSPSPQQCFFPWLTTIHSCGAEMISAAAEAMLSAASAHLLQTEAPESLLRALRCESAAKQSRVLPPQHSSSPRPGWETTRPCKALTQLEWAFPGCLCHALGGSLQGCPAVSPGRGEQLGMALLGCHTEPVQCRAQGGVTETTHMQNILHQPPAQPEQLVVCYNSAMVLKVKIQLP